MKTYNVRYTVECIIEYEKEFKSQSVEDLIFEIEDCYDSIISFKARDIQDVDIQDVEIINIDEIK